MSPSVVRAVIVLGGGSDVTAGAASISITNITDTQRFYRVKLVE
jgi:hypothetical protein